MTVIYTRADGTNCGAGDDVPYAQAKAVLDRYNNAQIELEQYKADWEKYFPTLSFAEVSGYFAAYRDEIKRLEVENLQFKEKLA
jgi:hypothetical protein